MKTWAGITALLVILSCVLIERCAASRPRAEGRRARETHRRLPPRPASVAHVAR